MVAPRSVSEHGIPPFHVHPGHAFQGFELVERQDASPVLLAHCDCGAVLDVAVARFTPCPDCTRGDPACMRCGGTGRVVDHTALEWQAPVE